MAKSQSISRTLGPIHFEDLEPHRFEDLVRELIYDFKDWHTIEATGRSGSDEGQDIRAFEKNVTDTITDDSEGEEATRTVEGNRWIVQCKREREIGPKRLKAYLNEIDSNDPPYGYILAAASNFSKESYDAFRSVLRSLGVMEFHLWGKAELEDMLHLPKNDRILFTFFGISLISRRRSRTTEIRSVVTIKNRLFGILDKDQVDAHQSILIRDLKDTKYPFRKQYPDFDDKPRWREYILFSHHPRGILTRNRKYYAYIDRDKKEWDFTREFDLLHREVQEGDREEKQAKRIRVVDIWDFLPRSQRGYLIIDGFVPYSEIALVDKEGDNLYKFPHLYVDFDGENGPFRGGHDYLRLEGGEELDISDDWKRINFFPKNFSKEKGTKFLKGKTLALDQATLKAIKSYDKIPALFAVDSKYDYLRARDVIEIDYSDRANEPLYIRITSAFDSTVEKYLSEHKDEYFLAGQLNSQIGRPPAGNERIRVIEFTRAWRPD